MEKALKYIAVGRIVVDGEKQCDLDLPFRKQNVTSGKSHA